MRTWLRFIRPVYFCILAILIACTSGVRAPVKTSSAQNRAVPVTSSSSQGQGYHVVKAGDTLYSIAWRYGLDFKNVAAWNDITPPYTIYPQQNISLRQTPGDHASNSIPAKTETASSPSSSPDRQSIPQSNNSRKPAKLEAINVDWQWPTSGKLVTINLPTSAKGLNISGKVGQDISAAAAGEVVYSGSGLLGYGKLIIIKHSDTYLSAYAHNEEILIKEGMKVTPGQNIATMGIGKNGMPLLHFEIRKDGKPVDPIQYLPDRKS